MKRFFIFSGFIILIIIICYNVPLVEQGCREGLLIWYNRLVPIILPFCLVSGLFMSLLDLSELGNVSAFVIMLICGIFMGYPIGGMTAGSLYDNKSLSKDTICAFMPLCNNVSPMFLIGYIYNDCLGKSIGLFNMLCYIYAPQLIYSLIYLSFCFIKSRYKKNYSPAYGGYAATLMKSDDCSNIPAQAVNTICIIGIYIVIFSIISVFINSFNRDCNLSISIISCFMEVTKGIPGIMSLNLPDIKKTALILSLAASGGISAIFQSVHMLKKSGLPVSNYIIGKLLCGAGTYIMVLLV